MTDQPFTLNNRFVVDPALHLFKDMDNGSEIRLEPRLVRLLCLFSENQGRLVSRELLITQIWDNYGGAEDSLNQAISFLRKVLQDVKKQIIETIPKKGYVLHATIDPIKIPVAGKEHKRAGLREYSRAVVALLVITLSTYLIMSHSLGSERTKSQEKITSEVSRTNRSLETNYAELNIPEEETYFNTITTTGPDGTLYRLVASGDKRPTFYINNQLLAVESREAYSKLIDNMLRQLWNRQKHHDDSLKLNNS